ncbi:MAG: hypothetical protein EBU90_05880 [Proteobacteria bacterium]|nr:hypothetical protein [Pseudomonadota bacterium]NBP15038.1 hypothetical protein [bacterium]
MKQHEREFFIYTIRSGKVFLPNNIIIHPPTIDIVIESLQKYNEAYEIALSDSIMTEEEMSSWMKIQGLWTSYNEQKITDLQKKLENLKVNIYEARQDKKSINSIRPVIRNTEYLLSQELSQKNTFFINTCEGMASTEKTSWLIQNTTYKNKKLYDFSDLLLTQVIDYWHESFLPENKCRELARNEPWKSLWITREKSGIELFLNAKNGELTYNQKNLMIWSQMYDNIQESLDCPSKEVIDDDDLLDGWFITQNRKREKEKLEKEFESSTQNPKIKQSSEVLIMSRDKDKTKKIQDMNSREAKDLIKSREKLLDKKGTVNAGEFLDEKNSIRLQQMESAKRHS